MNIRLASFMIAAIAGAGVTNAFALAATPGETSASEGAQEAEEVVTDAWITTKVKADLLATEDVPGTTIDVDTKDGTVTLNGTVKTKAEADKAVTVTKGIKGVKSVKSNLKVAPPAK